MHVKSELKLDQKEDGVIKQGFKAVLWIGIGFNADPDPAF